MNVWQEEFDEVLDRFERLISSGRPRPAVGREIQKYINWLHHLVLRSSAHGYPGRSMSQGLHYLSRRAGAARTAADLRDIVRDIRQYHMSISSLSRTFELEHRLTEIEDSVRAAGEEGPSTQPPVEPEVVTVQSLNGQRVLFAIMPFSVEFDDVWVGGIKRAAAGTGLVPIRIDMITQSSEVTDDIVKVIRDAEIVVVDVTGNNANVMFEFGFALALKKRHAVITQSSEYLTFDIKTPRSIIYKNSWQGIEALHKDLQSFVKGAIGSRPARKRRPKRAKRPTAAKV